MSGKILVAYASTHGSTQEIAETVAATLREQRLAVDLQPARAVTSLEGYTAVVLGAPLYILRLHKDGSRFLSRHRDALTSTPLAIFAGGPFGEGKVDEWQEVRRELDRELGKFPWLTPVSIHLVGGRFDPATLHFPWSLVPALRNMPPSDLRDWDAIRAWCADLAGLLQSGRSN